MTSKTPHQHRRPNRVPRQLEYLDHIMSMNAVSTPHKTLRFTLRPYQTTLARIKEPSGSIRQGQKPGKEIRKSWRHNLFGGCINRV